MDNEHEVVNTDQTFASRKFILVIIALGLVFAGAVLAAKMLGFAPSYEIYVGGIIGLTALYVGGNVSEKFFSGKINSLVKVAAITAAKGKEVIEEVKKDEPAAEEVKAD